MASQRPLTHTSPNQMIHHRPYPTHTNVNNVPNSITSKKPLNFVQAMSDFVTMFPEIDRDVIEAVLRSNNGVVQPTIDQLLVLQETMPNPTQQHQDKPAKSIKFPELPSYECSILPIEEAPPPYSDIWEETIAPKNKLFDNDQAVFQDFDKPVFDTSSISKSRWKPPLLGALSDDFLRLDIRQSTYKYQEPLTDNNRSTKKDDCENEVEQFLEDEKLAMFLQNEEFIRELRRNKDFVNSLNADHRRAMMESDGCAVAPTIESVPSGGARPRTTPSQEDAAFRQKLRHMGKSTRKKFGKMAKKFSRSKHSPKQILNNTMHPSESRFNLLEEEDDDLNEYQSDEIIYTINEDFNPDESNFETEEERKKKEQQCQQSSGRKLPQPPGSNIDETSQSSGRDEPIVFYSEDNEFAYKNET